MKTSTMNYFTTKYSTMKYLILFACVPILLSAFALNAHAADIRASLSTKEAYVGNPVVLRIEVSNANSQATPQIEAINGVDVIPVGTPSRSSQISIVNGRRSERSSVVYAWQLIPRRAGAFTIPPVSINVDGQELSTRSLRFSATKSETGDLLFAEIAGNEKEIFVGQAMKLKLRIWLRPFSDSDLDLTLSEGDMWQMISQEKSNWGMFSERIAELAENRQRPSGEEVLRADAEGVERRYYLYEIDATIYPKRPGKIDGDEVQIVVDYPTQLGKRRDPFDSFFDRGFSSPFGDAMPSMFGPRLAVTDVRPIVAGAKVNATEVLPIPTAGRPADYRGAVGHYQVITQATPLDTTAGDPITLHIGIQGDGPMDLVQAPPLAQLPELTRDFKVSDEPLAGIVQDDVKLFTTSIRARRKGVTHIPAIPFSFFDPEKKQFVTVHSDPIAITVGAPDTLALDAIVSRAGGSAASSDNGNTEPALRLTNFTGSEVLQPTSPTPPRWLIVIALLPPLFFLGSAVVRYQERLRARFLPSQGSDLKAALAELSAAASPAQVANLLRSFVAARTGGIDSSRTPDYSADQSQTSLSPETATRLKAILKKCEQHSYGGQTTSDLTALSSAAAECLQRLAAELPAVDNHRSFFSGAMHSAKNVAGKSAKAASLAVFGVALLIGSAHVEAAELTPSQSSQILTEAETAYAHAQQTSSTDSAESKQAFTRAAQKYQTLVDGGVSNDRLYFDLGNAYLQSGSIGLAIANYERALALNPASPARGNLVQARELLNPSEQRQAPGTELSFVEKMARWNESIPRSLVIGIGLAAWAIVWLILSRMLFKHETKLRRIAIPVAIVAAICATSLVFASLAGEHQDRVVVIAPEVHLREGNGEAFAELNAVVREGAAYDLLEQRGDWLKVAADGTSGWVNDRDAVVVSAHPDRADESVSPEA